MDLSFQCELVIVDLSKDWWGFKGQTGVVLVILPNLWHVTETPLNKTAYADVVVDAPIIHTVMGLGALNLLRSDRLEH